MGNPRAGLLCAPPWHVNSGHIMPCRTLAPTYVRPCVKRCCTRAAILLLQVPMRWGLTRQGQQELL